MASSVGVFGGRTETMVWFRAMRMDAQEAGAVASGERWLEMVFMMEGVRSGCGLGWIRIAPKHMIREVGDGGALRWAMREQR